MRVTTNKKLGLQYPKALLNSFCIAGRGAPNMNHGHLHPFQFKHLPLWIELLHLLIVNISINGAQGFVWWQSTEDAHISDISSMPNLIYLL
jgi:hypothetical protein